MRRPGVVTLAWRLLAIQTCLLVAHDEDALMVSLSLSERAGVDEGAVMTVASMHQGQRTMDCQAREIFNIMLNVMVQRKRIRFDVVADDKQTAIEQQSLHAALSFSFSIAVRYRQQKLMVQGHCDKSTRCSNLEQRVFDPISCIRQWKSGWTGSVPVSILEVCAAPKLMVKLVIRNPPVSSP